MRLALHELLSTRRVEVREGRARETSTLQLLQPAPCHIPFPPAPPGRSSLTPNPLPARA